MLVLITHPILTANLNTITTKHQASIIRHIVTRRKKKKLAKWLTQFGFLSVNFFLSFSAKVLPFVFSTESKESEQHTKSKETCLACEPLSPVVGRISVWAEASVTFSVSLSASLLVEMKNTLPLGVVTTLDTTGLLVSKLVFRLFQLLAIVDGVSCCWCQWIKCRICNSCSFTSFLFMAAKSALEIEMVREFGLITARYLERSTIRIYIVK